MKETQINTSRDERLQITQTLLSFVLLFVLAATLSHVARPLSTALSAGEKSDSAHTQTALPGLFFSKPITIAMGGTKPQIL